MVLKIAVELDLVIQLALDLFELTEHIAHLVDLGTHVIILIITQVFIFFSDTRNDLRVNEVGLSRKASDQESNDVSCLAINGAQLQTSVNVVTRVNFGVGIEQLELASVEGVKLDPRVVNRILE